MAVIAALKLENIKDGIQDSLF